MIEQPLPGTNTRPRRGRDWHRLGWHLAGLFPLAWLVFDYWFGLLGPEPIRAIILRTGKSALIMLVLSLACTPAGYVLGWKRAANWRRPLGLYAFMYVCLHLLAFVWLDYSFMWQPIIEEVIERRYALVGFAAFLLLIPLALTSNRWSQRRLGRRWKTLHRLVYLIAVLAIIHYIWLVKFSFAQPALFAAAVGALLLLRLRPVRQAIARRRRQAAAPNA